MIESNNIKNLMNRYHENRLSHAFLLETNNQKKCFKDLIQLLKIINCPNVYKEKCSDCNLCELFKDGNLPSLKIVECTASVIKKEQILDVINSFVTKPVFSKFNMYIVKDADRLNSSSGNTLLKFLEEPEDNILGFFITNNKENVLSTVRSRCQIVSCHYDENGYSYDDEILDNVRIYLQEIYKSYDDLYYNKSHMSNLYSDRKKWEDFFTTMLFYFKDYLEKKNTVVIDVMKNFNNYQMIGIIGLIENTLKYIKSNVNMDLILDKFVIEMRKFYG